MRQTANGSIIRKPIIMALFGKNLLAICRSAFATGKAVICRLPLADSNCASITYYIHTILSGQNGYAADTSFSYNNGTTNLLENELNKRMSEQEQIKEKKAFMNAEKEYPPISKPSPSVQVIATRNRPCCDFQDQRAPVCLLFSIFLVVSVFVCCGVMLYIKSGI